MGVPTGLNNIIDVIQIFYDKKQNYYEDYLKPSIKESYEMKLKCETEKIPFIDYCEMLDYFAKLDIEPYEQYRWLMKWLENDDAIIDTQHFSYYSDHDENPSRGGTGVRFTVDLQTMDIINLFEDVFTNKKILSYKILQFHDSKRCDLLHCKFLFELEKCDIELEYTDDNASCAGHHVEYIIRELVKDQL